MQDKPIKQVFESMTLGVIVDQHLSWKINTDNVCKKIRSGICALRRLREFVDQDTLLSVFNAVVQPYCTYCCEVWNVFGETQSTSLQKLHNRAARIIANMRNEEDQSALSALGWQLLKAQRGKAKAKIMFKILNNMGLNYNLRDRSNTVCFLQPLTHDMKKSFIFYGAFIWNSLPANIRESKSLLCFEQKIAIHVFRY